VDSHGLHMSTTTMTYWIKRCTVIEVKGHIADAGGQHRKMVLAGYEIFYLSRNDVHLPNKLSKKIQGQWRLTQVYVENCH